MNIIESFREGLKKAKEEGIDPYEIEITSAVWEEMGRETAKALGVPYSPEHRPMKISGVSIKIVDA